MKAYVTAPGWSSLLWWNEWLRLRYSPVLMLAEKHSMSSGLGFILRRRQLPIRLAFGMSINKAQGQSLDRVGIYLNNPIFAHGQLYVALSRCTDCRNLRILLPPNSNRRTSNIVYREVIEWVHRKVSHNKSVLHIICSYNHESND